MAHTAIVPTGFEGRHSRKLRFVLDRQQLPPLMRNGLYVALVGLALIALPYLGRSYGPISATVVLDAWVVVFVLWCLFRGKTRAYLLLFALLGYLLTRVVPAMAIGAPLEDFLQAYRWVLYLIAIALALGRTWGPIDGLVRVTWALVIAATMKSLATYVLLGPGERPGLLLENNFEIALFCGLAAVLYAHLGRKRGWMIVTLGLLTALSGSRSGAVVFVVLALYAVSQLRSNNLLTRYVLALGAVALLVFPIAVFTERSEGTVYRIDRLNFLDVFITETRGWSPLTWLFGTTPITPLSPGSCSALSAYPLLFSSTGDGSCYVVILHAFLLRVVFDAGLIGLALSIVVPWVVMRRAGVTRLLTATLTVIAIANGASVSGLNNPYVALPIIVAIMTAAATTKRPPASPGEEAEGRDLETAGRAIRRGTSRIHSRRE